MPDRPGGAIPAGPVFFRDSGRGQSAFQVQRSCHRAGEAGIGERLRSDEVLRETTKLLPAPPTNHPSADAHWTGSYVASGSPVPRRRTFATGIHALRSLGPACASPSGLRLSATPAHGTRATPRCNAKRCADRSLDGAQLQHPRTASADAQHAPRRRRLTPGTAPGSRGSVRRDRGERRRSSCPRSPGDGPPGSRPRRQRRN